MRKVTRQEPSPSEDPLETEIEFARRPMQVRKTHLTAAETAFLVEQDEAALRSEWRARHVDPDAVPWSAAYARVEADPLALFFLGLILLERFSVPVLERGVRPVRLIEALEGMK